MLAQALECTPQSGILCECLSIHLGCLLSFDLALVDLAEEIESCSTVWDLAQDVLLRVMLLEWTSLSSVEECLLSLLILVKLQTGECKFVPVCILHAILEHFICLVSLALA